MKDGKEACRNLYTQTFFKPKIICIISHYSRPQVRQPRKCTKAKKSFNNTCMILMSFFLSASFYADSKTLTKTSLFFNHAVFWIRKYFLRIRIRGSGSGWPFYWIRPDPECITCGQKFSVKTVTFIFENLVRFRIRIRKSALQIPIRIQQANEIPYGFGRKKIDIGEAAKRENQKELPGKRACNYLV